MADGFGSLLELMHVQTCNTTHTAAPDHDNDHYDDDDDYDGDGKGRRGGRLHVPVINLSTRKHNSTASCAKGESCEELACFSLRGDGANDRTRFRT